MDEIENQGNADAHQQTVEAIGKASESLEERPSFARPREADGQPAVGPSLVETSSAAFGSNCAAMSEGVAMLPSTL